VSARLAKGDARGKRSYGERGAYVHALGMFVSEGRAPLICPQNGIQKRPMAAEFYFPFRC